MEAGLEGRKRLQEIPGMVPSLREAIEGCIFAPRCAYATDRCRRAQLSPLTVVTPRWILQLQAVTTNPWLWRTHAHVDLSRDTWQRREYRAAW